MKRVPYKTLDKIKLADQEILMLILSQSKYTVCYYGKFQHELDLCILLEYCTGGNLRCQLKKMKLIPI